ncbi:MAG: methionine synthase [Paracoccaceae bacterium]
MRVLGIISYTLAGLGAGIAIWFYIWAQGLACAYGTASGQCDLSAPWQLASGDLFALVIVPWGIVAVLVLSGWGATRAARRRR